LETQSVSNFRVKLDGNLTLSLQTAGALQGDGTRGRIWVEQGDAGSHTLQWGGVGGDDPIFDGGNAAEGSLSAAANAVDVFEYEVDIASSSYLIRKLAADVKAPP
jgi:hypothetical protein